MKNINLVNNSTDQIVPRLDLHHRPGSPAGGLEQELASHLQNRMLEMMATCPCCHPTPPPGVSEMENMAFDLFFIPHFLLDHPPVLLAFALTVFYFQREELKKK